MLYRKCSLRRALVPEGPYLITGELESSQGVIALVSGLNALRDRWPNKPPPRMPMVMRSGWSEDPETPAWFPSYRPVFERFVGEAAHSGCELWLWPRSSDLLSDTPSIGWFLRAFAEHGFGIVLDPAALVTEEMQPRKVEHVERICELVGQTETVKVLVDDVIDGRRVIDIIGREHAGLCGRVWVLDRESSD